MNRSFIRLVVLLLIPCLIADPSFAFALDASIRPQALNPSINSLYQENALSTSSLVTRSLLRNPAAWQHWRSLHDIHRGFREIKQRTFFPVYGAAFGISVLALLLPGFSPAGKLAGAVFGSLLGQYLGFWSVRLYLFKFLSPTGRRWFAWGNTLWWGVNLLAGIGFIVHAFATYRIPATQNTSVILQAIVHRIFLPPLVGINLINLYLYRLMNNDSLEGAVFGKRDDGSKRNSLAAPLGGVVGMKILRDLRNQYSLRRSKTILTASPISYEPISVVDEHNHFIGVMALHSAHEAEARHRVTVVLPYDPRTGKVLVQLRPASMMNEPGKLGAFGGHVAAGQSDLESATEEISSELFPVDQKRLIPVGSQWFPKVSRGFNGKPNREFQKIYLLPLTPEEVDEKIPRLDTDARAYHASPSLNQSHPVQARFTESAGYAFYSPEDLAQLNRTQPEQVADTLHDLFDDPSQSESAAGSVAQALQAALDHLARKESRAYLTQGDLLNLHVMWDLAQPLTESQVAIARHLSKEIDAFLNQLIAVYDELRQLVETRAPMSPADFEQWQNRIDLLHPLPAMRQTVKAPNSDRLLVPFGQMFSVLLATVQLLLPKVRGAASLYDMAKKDLAYDLYALSIKIQRLQFFFERLSVPFFNDAYDPPATREHLFHWLREKGIGPGSQVVCVGSGYPIHFSSPSDIGWEMLFWKRLGADVSIYEPALNRNADWQEVSRGEKTWNDLYTPDDTPPDRIPREGVLTVLPVKDAAFEKSHLTPGSVDVVVMMSMFTHFTAEPFSQPWIWADTASRILRPGGLLVLGDYHNEAGESDELLEILIKKGFHVQLLASGKSEGHFWTIVQVTPRLPEETDRTHHFSEGIKAMERKVFRALARVAGVSKEDVQAVVSPLADSLGLSYMLFINELFHLCDSKNGRLSIAKLNHMMAIPGLASPLQDALQKLLAPRNAFETSRQKAEKQFLQHTFSVNAQSRAKLPDRTQVYRQEDLTNALLPIDTWKANLHYLKGFKRSESPVFIPSGVALRVPIEGPGDRDYISPGHYHCAIAVGTGRDRDGRRWLFYWHFAPFEPAPAKEFEVEFKKLFADLQEIRIFLSPELTIHSAEKLSRLWDADVVLRSRRGVAADILFSKERLIYLPSVRGGGSAPETLTWDEIAAEAAARATPSKQQALLPILGLVTSPTTTRDRLWGIGIYLSTLIGFWILDRLLHQASSFIRRRTAPAVDSSRLTLQAA